MSTEESPAARRLRRPTWRDPRLGVGVLLVAGSVALTTWVVGDASRTVDVYAAEATLTPGDRLTDEDVRVLQARPGGPEGTYLLVADGLPEDGVLTRVVGEGEMIPAAAVGRVGDVDLRPVVVPLTGTVPTGLGPGTVVDLWLTDPARPGAATEERAEPSLLAGDLVVADLVESDTLFTGGTGTSVEVLVPRAELAGVLDALSGDGAVVVVPVPGGGG
ncbi:hypothetical protein [Georgenia faecalis]|uniref:SAF domain-containing protein n=1 Tax=Georgenia faecalis TaxID=2483799 RepID=A0ABV9DBE1_9MICO|nr:hypothetical protein [Georgenia faecalis]